MDSPSPLRRSSRTSSCNKENSPLNSPSKRNTAARRTPPEHDTTPTRKRRRQSVKPQTDLASNTSANAKQPHPHTQPTPSEQEALDAKKERDARKKARRSLGRRVSFAATARVRLFNKDATPEISPEAARKSRYFALDDLQESSLGSKESPLGLSMFQIPDLSSVVTGGDNTFDLRLSLDGSDQTTNQESDEREIEESSEQDVAPTTTEASLLPVPSNQESHLIHVPTALSKIIGAEDVIVRRSSLGSNEDHMQRSGGAQEDILQTEDFAVFMDPPSFDDAMDMTECLGGINTEPFENTENILPCQSTRLDIFQHHMPNNVEDRTADRFEMSPISSRRISMVSPSYRTDNMHFAESSTAMDLTRCLGGIITDKDGSQQDEEVHNSVHDAICELERETNDPTMDITRCIGGIREAKPADHRYLASLAVIEEERKNVTAPVPIPDDDLYLDHVEYNIHLNDGYHQANSSASFVADDDDDMDLTRCVGTGYRQEDDRNPGASNVSHESQAEENAQRTNPLLPLEPAVVTMEATYSADSEIISSTTVRRERTQRNTPTLVLEPPPGDMRTESPAVADEENVVLKEPVARDCGPRPSEEPVKEKVPHCSPRRPRGGYVSSPLRTVTTMLSPGKVVTNVALSRQAVIVNRRKSLSAAAADLSSRLVSSTSTRRSSFAGALGKPAFEVENSSNGSMVSISRNANSVPSPAKSKVENSSNGAMVSVSGNADPVPSPTKSTKSTVKKADTSAPPPAARRLSFTPATARDSEKIASATPQHSPNQEHRTSVVDPPLNTTTVTISTGAPDCKSADLKAYSEPDRAKSPPLNTTTAPSSTGVPDYESTNLKAYSEPIRAIQPVESVTSSPVSVSVQKRNSGNDDAKNHLGELDEPCLFGEHLDIVDDSFIAEIPEPDPITLSMFFEMTGIHFMDELSSTKRRETLSEKENDCLPSFADCVKATAILCPELERNEFCCNELEKYITEGKRSVSKMEEAVNRDNPPVFADLIRTQPDSDDRNRMLANFRIMKSRARLEARSSWYRWREQLLNSAKCGLKTVSDQLKRDYKYVTRFAEQVDALLPELKQHRAILAARCEEAKSRQEAISTCDRKQMQSLNEAIREQSTQVDFYRQQLVQAELEGTELNERATALEAEKTSLLVSISSARSSLDECAGFDKADLFRLRVEFDRLKRYHLWTPVAASRNALELVYDGRVRARIDVSGRSEKERVLESLNLVEPEKDRTEKESRVTTATFLAGILHLSIPKCSNTSRPISWTLRNVSGHCHRLGIIEQEISLLRLRRPVSVSHDASALRVRVIFVGLQRLVKFRVEFEIGFEGAENGGRGFRYPFGELKWTVEKAYGVVDEDTVSDVMSAHEQDGYHRLLGICRDLDVLIQ